MNQTKKIGLTLFFVLFFCCSFSTDSYASDSGSTAREVAQDVTESQWQMMKDYFSQTPVAATEGYTIGTDFSPDFEQSCQYHERNEYNYTGSAKRIITKITSSDPDTLEVSYSNHTIQMKRGKGNNDHVLVTIEYHLEWSFRVQEKVLGTWWSVNDQIGSTGTFTDSIDVTVEQIQFTVTPKSTNRIELNLYDPKKIDPLTFVDYSGNTGPVTSYMQEKPDDSKLGATQGKFVFSDTKYTQAVVIPFTVVDTTPPTGRLKDPLTMELGTLPNLVDLFDYEPYDNDWQTVDILSSFDFKQLKKGTQPIQLILEDQSKNQAKLTSTIEGVDTTPPNVATKSATIEYGEKIDPSDFIVSATDNDPDGGIAYSFEKQPDRYQSGTQEVTILATDASKNTVKVKASLIVKPDITAPSADGILQMVPINGSLSTDPLTTVTNLKDNEDVTKLSCKYLVLPDTSKVGLTSTTVEIADRNGNKSQVKVGVFVYDDHSIYDKQYVLSAQNFTLYSNEVDGTTIDETILKKSKAKAWDISSGKEKSDIKVITQNVQNKFGTYTATLAIGQLTQTIQINVLDAKELIDISLPQKVIFGSTDIQHGTVNSPKYEIVNHSTVPVDVQIAQIKVDPASTIPLLDQASSPEEKKAGVELKLITSEGFLDQSFAVDTILKQTLGILHAQEKGNFIFSGNYYGSYKKSAHCNFTMIFKFEAQ